MKFNIDPTPVMEEVEELRSVLNETPRNRTLERAAEALDKKDKSRVLSLLASSEDDKIAIKKWFSTVNEDKYPEIIHQSPNYIAVRTAKNSKRKQQVDDDNDGTYHAVWVVGSNDHTRHFIHRLQWEKSFEEPTIDWSIDEVMDHLGIDAHLEDESKGQVQEEKWYRVQGDLRLLRSSLDDFIKERVGSQSQSVIGKRKREIRKEVYKEVPSKLHEKVSISDATFPRVRVSVNEDTKKLKSLQSDLDITEAEIREYQESRDWERLTAKRRKKAIKGLLRVKHISPKESEYRDRIEEEIDEEKFKADAERQVIQSLESEVKQVNFTVGNHLVAFKSAIQNGGLIRQSRSDSPDAIQTIVPEKTELIIEHDEHNSFKKSTPPGVYYIDGLIRHSQL